jgi:hypothetical protein
LFCLYINHLETPFIFRVSYEILSGMFLALKSITTCSSGALPGLLSAAIENMKGIEWKT